MSLLKEYFFIIDTTLVLFQLSSRTYCSAFIFTAMYLFSYTCPPCIALLAEILFDAKFSVAKSVNNSMPKNE